MSSGRVRCVVDSSELHPSTLLRVAATLAHKSVQQWATEIVAFSENSQGKVKDVAKDFQELPGQGMTGLIAKNSRHDTRFFLGDWDYVAQALNISKKCPNPQTDDLTESSDEVWFFANTDRLLGHIVIKPNSLH